MLSNYIQKPRATSSAADTEDLGESRFGMVIPIRLYGDGAESYRAFSGVVCATL